MNITDFNATVAKLSAAAAAYYNGEDEQMTDAEYDSLVADLEIASAEDPSLVSAAYLALVEQIAAGQSEGGDVPHSEPMLSLGKVSESKVAEFIKSLDGDVMVEPKLDGIAIRAVYLQGVLSQVVTRGDGLVGEDITGNVIGRVYGLPNLLNNKIDVEVRGEVYMSDSDFKAANLNRQMAGGEPFANSRNAAAGAVRKIHPYVTPMSFAVYDSNLDLPQASDALSQLSREGFIPALYLLNDPMLALTSNKSLTPVPHDPADKIAWIGENKDNLGFPIDGCVVKAETIADRVRLGAGSRAPKWAVAFKYEAESSTTVIEDIEYNLGRTGRLSIRAKVTPVSVGGTTITYASCHNVGFMEREDIRIGDTVAVKRANDVIPYISDPVLDLRPADSIAWVPPTACPQCGEPFDKSTELWRCTTPECSTLGRITYAAARDCLDIEGMSVAVATSLVESGRVSDIADLFTLTTDELADLPIGSNARRLGESSAQKIIAEIEKAKGQPLNRIITSLGLRKTGRTMGRRLAAEFTTMAAFQAATVTQLTNVEGVADGKAQSIHAELKSMEGIIFRLAEAGVNMGTKEEAAPASTGGGSALAGLKVVVTGKMTGPLSAVSRNEMSELIESHGGKASGSVSSSTDLLVCAEQGSSKYEKAVELGVKIVSPEEFAAMIGA